MKKTVIKANKIDSTKAADLRRAGKLPAVLYGALVESQKISLDYNSFLKQYRVCGQSTVVDLDVDGDVTPVLVHTVQFHPVTERLLHVDFYAINPKKPVSVTVHLNFIGDPVGVRTKGGIMVTEKNDVTVKCLPKYLMSHIDVDIDVLDDIGKAIHIRDLVLPENVEIMDHDEVLVVHIIPPKLAVSADDEESDETVAEGAEVEDSTESKEE